MDVTIFNNFKRAILNLKIKFLKRKFPIILYTLHDIIILYIATYTRITIL